MQLQKPADLARLVKTRRQALDLTQHDVADSVGITRQSLARIERGHGGASFDTVLRIFERLGIIVEATPNRQITSIDSSESGRDSDVVSLIAAALTTGRASENSAIAAAASAASQNTYKTRPQNTHDARRAALRAAIEVGDPDLESSAADTEIPQKRKPY